VHRSLLLTTAALAALFPAALRAHDVAAAMATAAQALLNALDDTQRRQATFVFADAERENWHFIPRERRGLPLKAMNAAQRELATALLSTALSERGLATAQTIISLETVLAAIEKDPVRRDPEKYFFSIFGAPGTAPWGWRCEGHHISLNVTVAGSSVVVSTPHFFGSNPAEVRSGPMKGVRALGRDEDLGRAFVRSLDATQRPVAIIRADAPGDIFSVPGRDDTKPAGIPWSQLTSTQQTALLELVKFYVGRFRPELAADALEHLATAGQSGLHFAWAGGLEPGDAHYYRIQSDWFVIEYDNVQNGANHAHTVWREFGKEFGRDALAEHYRAAHTR
jgi:hypothetical protein